MSGSRIKVAGRFLPCVHMGGFDLEVFVELNQRSRKACLLSLSKKLDYHSSNFLTICSVAFITCSGSALSV